MASSMSVDGSSPEAIGNISINHVDLPPSNINDSPLERSQPHLTAPWHLDVYQQITPEPPSDRDSTATTCTNLIDRARLIVDEEDADYHIISHAEITDEHCEPNPTEDTPLLALFFRPFDDADPHKRYLRCAQDQLRDLKEWFAEQQQHPTIIPARNRSLESNSTPALTSEDRALCRRQLLAIFRPWSEDEQHLAAMTLYCTANVIGDLAIPELIAVIRTGMRLTSGAADLVCDADQFAKVVDSCIHRLNQILVRESGRLVFQKDTMKAFVRQVNLPNVPAGHLTMTRICFEQIRQLGSALIIHPWHRFSSWFNSMSEWPLIGYVVKNWFLHYRMTADRADIHSEVYHLIREALLVKIPEHPSMHLERRVVDAGYGISQIYRLPGLEAVLLNMGARTTLATNPVLGKIPQWKLLSWKKVSYEDWMVHHGGTGDDLEVHEDDVDDFLVVQRREPVPDLDMITHGIKQLNTFGASTSTLDTDIEHGVGHESGIIDQSCGSELSTENHELELNTEMIDEV